MNNIQPLTTDSTPVAIRAYFDFIFESEQSGEEFPVDFDIVWPLAYSLKRNAKRSLVEDFFEGEDYRIINKNLENTIHRNVDGEEADHLRRNEHGSMLISEHGEKSIPKNGDGRQRNADGTIAEEKIFLSTKCMEFFVARKVRPIFEVYRQCRIEVARLHGHGAPIQMQRRRTPQQLQNEVVLPVLVAFIQQTGDYAGRVSDLMAELEHAAPAIVRQQHWPKSPSLFGACLSRLGPPLREHKIEFVHGSRWGSGQRVALHINHELTAQSSVPQLN